MNRAGTMFFNGAAMLFSTVPFVLGKAILHILRIEFNHKAITSDFCQDGGSGDAEGFCCRRE